MKSEVKLFVRHVLVAERVEDNGESKHPVPVIRCADGPVDARTKRSAHTMHNKSTCVVPLRG